MTNELIFKFWRVFSDFGGFFGFWRFLLTNNLCEVFFMEICCLKYLVVNILYSAAILYFLPVFVYKKTKSS